MNKNALIRFTPFFIVLMNLVIKTLYITSNSIGGDEPFSIYHAQMNISSIIFHLSSGNNPPFYEIFLHYWIKLFGISELSVRFPSLIFSSFTVYFIYKTGKEFFNIRVAILASLLFTFSNYHILFSHEARVYALFALLTTVSMYYFLKICHSNKNNKYYILLVLVNALLIYSHYFSFFIIGLQTISVIFISDIRKQNLRKYLVYIIVLLILYIPNMYILVTRFLVSATYGTWVKPPNGIVSIYNMLWQFSNKPITTVVCIILLIAAFIKLILNKETRNISVNNKIILIWFLFPFSFMFIISYWIPMFFDRYLVFVSVGYYFIIVVCASNIIKQTKYNFILPGVLIILFVITFNPKVDNKRHVKEAVIKIKELKDAHSKVYIYPQYFILNFAYYYNPEIFKDVDNENVYDKMTERFKKENIFAINNIDEINSTNDDKIIFLDAFPQFSFPNNHIPILERNYNLKDEFKIYEIFTIFEYIKR